MKRTVLLFSAILLSAIGNLCAQTYYYTPWYGPKGIGINTGLTCTFNDPTFSYDKKKLELTDFSQKLMSPLIGIFHSEDGINGALAYGLEMDLNYLVTGASATFLDNINTNKYECSFRQKNLQWHIMFHVGYAFSDDITLCVETGFGKLLSVGSQCVIKENGIETLRQKEGWAILSNLGTAITIPIALRGTYFITDNLFIKGTLNFNMININLFGEDLDVGIKKATTLGVFDVNQNNSVTYANDWKAVSFILSFGYEWDR